MKFRFSCKKLGRNCNYEIQGRHMTAMIKKIEKHEEKVHESNKKWHQKDSYIRKR